MLKRELVYCLAAARKVYEFIADARCVILGARQNGRSAGECGGNGTAGSEWWS